MALTVDLLGGSLVLPSASPPIDEMAAHPVLATLNLARSSSWASSGTVPLLPSPERESLTPTRNLMWLHRREQYTSRMHSSSGAAEDMAVRAAAVHAAVVHAAVVDPPTPPAPAPASALEFSPLVAPTPTPPPPPDFSPLVAPTTAAPPPAFTLDPVLTDRVPLPDDGVRSALLGHLGPDIVGRVRSVVQSVPPTGNERYSAILPYLLMGNVPLRRDQGTFNMKLIVKTADLDSVDARLGSATSGVASIDIPMMGSGSFSDLEEHIPVVDLFHRMANSMLEDKRVLVFCLNGENRSALVTAGFVMWLFDLEPAEAMTYVQICRPKACDRSGELAGLRAGLIRRGARK
ncbi:MAG: hypothetical protein SP1CHLAM54_07450 [Chlamydiia bacterium]|nr:hypothetical protein [Chlamydiia bacterium]MCH9615651.1 hypothetical protein [Chlamydiia bacterium]MCH9628946.1 hypothetical protein [Chlamydiia bacterium]